MFYLIQKDCFRTQNELNLFDTLNRFGLEYEIIRFAEMEGKRYLEFTTDKKENIFLFGSIRLANIGKKYGWKPGSFYNENHDAEVYGKYYGENMLNHDGVIMNFSDPLPNHLPYVFFSRPTKDTKTFSGKVFTRDSWIESVEEVRQRKYIDYKLNLDTTVLVAPLKEIQQEIRCFIVKGKVITISAYKIGNFVVYKNYDHEEDIIEFANKMAGLYQPAEAFVLDVARTEFGLKVIEINCINSAGFYDINMNKLINSLEENFN